MFLITACQISFRNKWSKVLFSQALLFQLGLDLKQKLNRSLKVGMKSHHHMVLISLSLSLSLSLFLRWLSLRSCKNNLRIMSCFAREKNSRQKLFRNFLTFLRYGANSKETVIRGGEMKLSTPCQFLSTSQHYCQCLFRHFISKQGIVECMKLQRRNVRKTSQSKTVAGPILNPQNMNKKLMKDVFKRTNFLSSHSKRNRTMVLLAKSPFHYHHATKRIFRFDPTFTSMSGFRTLLKEDFFSSQKIQHFQGAL